MAVAMKRLQALIRAKRNEGLTQMQVAADLGRSQGWIVQILGDELKSVDVEVIAAATRVYGIDANYFTDVKIEHEDDYTKHLRRRRPTETRLELDELPALTAYRAWWKREHNSPMPDRYVEAVVGLARSDGPDAITHEAIDDLVKLRRAVERGKATPRPRDPENVVDEKAGQTKAPERGRKR